MGKRERDIGKRGSVCVFLFCHSGYESTGRVKTKPNRGAFGGHLEAKLQVNRWEKSNRQDRASEEREREKQKEAKNDNQTKEFKRPLLPLPFLALCVVRARLRLS